MLQCTVSDPEIPFNEVDLPVTFIHGGGWLLGGGIGRANLWHIEERAHVASLRMDGELIPLLFPQDTFVIQIA